MRVAQIEISNIRGIEALTVQAGSITIVSGANGTGKSSVLDAIRAAFEGGHAPELIRRGAKKAEVKLTLDSGTVIRKTISDKTSLLEVKTADGSAVKAPQAFVDSLARSFAFDPTSFIRAKPKERLDYMVNAMGLTFTRDEVSEAADGFPVSKPVLSLEDLAAYRKGKYDERTIANVAIRELDGTINTLTRALPEDEGKDWGAEAESLSRQLTNVKTVLTETLAEVSFSQAATREALVRERDIELDRVRQEYEKKLTELDRDGVNRRAEFSTQAQPMIEDLTKGLAEANEHSKAQQRAAGTRDAIEEHRRKSREHAKISLRLDRVLEGLDALRAKKLETIPIPDVTIEDGKIYVGGIEFDQLNTAQKYTLSLQIGSLSLGELGFMIADDGEHLGRENWEALKQAVKEANGLQLVIARLESDLPLTVTAA